MKGHERIEHVFKQGKCFVPYLTAGDHGIDQSLAAAKALIKGGATMLEIGAPFSDPIADGPVIQRASDRALKLNTNLTDILWLVRQIRKMSQIPIILFSYLNPILASPNCFFTDAKNSGVDGILIVDGPLEELSSIRQHCLLNGIAPIYIIAPNTPIERAKKMNEQGQGFLYYACRKGTTGVRTHLPSDFVERIQFFKSHITLPIIAGFGIADRETAAHVLKYADGVVIGSFFVQALENGISSAGLQTLTMQINPLMREQPTCF